jgi:hypothetical protein
LPQRRKGRKEKYEFYREELCVLCAFAAEIILNHENQRAMVA